MTAVKRMYLPAPEPYAGPEGICSGCTGAGVTGARYQMAVTGAGLLVDVVCPDCDGCGRSIHDDCTPEMHAEWERDDLEDDDPDVEPAEVCLSCHGRRWWACQGFTETTVYVLRVPCGCAQDLMVELPAEAVSEPC